MADQESVANGVYHPGALFLTGTGVTVLKNDNNGSGNVSNLTGVIKIQNEDAYWSAESTVYLTYHSQSLFTNRVYDPIIDSDWPVNQADKGGGPNIVAGSEFLTNAGVGPDAVYLTGTFVLWNSAMGSGKSLYEGDEIGNKVHVQLDSMNYWLGKSPRDFSLVPVIKCQNIAEFVTVAGRDYELALSFSVVASSSNGVTGIRGYVDGGFTSSGGNNQPNVFFGRPWVVSKPGMTTFTLTKLADDS